MHGGAGAAVDEAGVLAEGDVLGRVQPVLDGPVAAVSASRRAASAQAGGRLVMP